jgi:hypothetical protein
MDIDEAEFRDVSLSASARTQLSMFAISGANYSGDSLRRVFLSRAVKHPEQLTTHRWSVAATAIRQTCPVIDATCCEERISFPVGLPHPTALQLVAFHGSNTGSNPVGDANKRLADAVLVCGVVWLRNIT